MRTCVRDAAAFRRTTLPPKRRERSEYRLSLIEVDIANFAAVAPVPAEGGAAELLGPLRAEAEAEFKRLDQTDRRKLGGRSKSLGGIVPVERVAKPSSRRASELIHRRGLERASEALIARSTRES